jgi:D-arabinose 1-dehydrogenase-like Zn-dependent alcohol dehydrogenase
LEQADAAVETAKKALKQGDNATTSQVSHQCNYCLAHTTSSNSNMVCEKQHTVCYALHDGLQQLMSEMLHNLISCL